MQVYLGSLIAIVFIVIAANVFIVFRRSRGALFSRSRRPVMDEEEAALIRDRLIQSRLEHELEESEEFIERRRRTFALYEYVRRKAAAAEQGSAAFNEAPEIDPGAIGFRKSMGLPFDDNHKSDSKIDTSLFIPFDD